jgi:hypothetical protein
MPTMHSHYFVLGKARYTIAIYLPWKAEGVDVFIDYIYCICYSYVWKLVVASYYYYFHRHHLKNIVVQQTSHDQCNTIYSISASGGLTRKDMPPVLPPPPLRRTSCFHSSAHWRQLFLSYLMEPQMKSSPYQGLFHSTTKSFLFKFECVKDSVGPEKIFQFLRMIASMTTILP